MGASFKKLGTVTDRDPVPDLRTPPPGAFEDLAFNVRAMRSALRGKLRINCANGYLTLPSVGLKHLRPGRIIWRMRPGVARPKAYQSLYSIRVSNADLSRNSLIPCLSFC